MPQCEEISVLVFLMLVIMVCRLIIICLLYVSVCACYDTYVLSHNHRAKIFICFTPLEYMSVQTAFENSINVIFFSFTLPKLS